MATLATTAGVPGAHAAELRALVRLALPVVIAELGWMAMWLVDTMLVGRVGAEAIGAVSVGGNLFFTIAIFGMGLLLGLDYTVAHAHGAGRTRAAHEALIDGMYLGVVATAALTAVACAAIPLLAHAGLNPRVLAQARPYFAATLWSLLPLLLFAAFRRYLQGLGLVLPVTATIVSANLVNAAAGWILIFGKLGAPALGAEGAGWATTASRLYMLLALVAYVVWRERRHATGLFRVSLRPRLARLARLARLGLPAALQTSLEVGAFACATTLAATLDATALAAHQLALNTAATSFMVPLGVSSAAAVRVAQSLGRRDVAGARRAGWIALAIAALVMLSSGLAFVLAPRAILRAFTDDPAVIETGVALLRVAALFQLFDGVQVVATGALRGTGDTRTPMIANLGGYWLLGLPIGYVLCFRQGLGIIGLWIGLSIGLVVVALALLYAWSRRLPATAGA
jgi:MATE family multidrug resistance protein